MWFHCILTRTLCFHSSSFPSSPSSPFLSFSLPPSFPPSPPHSLPPSPLTPSLPPYLQHPTACGDLPISEHGNVNYSNGILHGSIATFNCDFGYLSTNPLLTIARCLNGSWTPHPPNCVRKCNLSPWKRVTVVPCRN